MAERVLLDTDVFSYLFGKRPEAEKLIPLLQNKKLCLAFISIGELYYGAHKRQWGAARFNYLLMNVTVTQFPRQSY